MKNKLFYLAVGVIFVQHAYANDIINFFKNPVKETTKAVETTVEGVGKWASVEAIPTLTGQKKLEIKPYISITHNGQGFKVGPNEAYAKIGGVSLSTHNLSQRLLDLGCIAEAGVTGAVI